MNNKGYFMDLWCRTCRYHKCRCEWTGELRVPWPIKRMSRAEYEQQYVEDRKSVTFTGEPQYTRTMTMDDLRRNALESVIEELKERDA